MKTQNKRNKMENLVRNLAKAMLLLANSALVSNLFAWCMPSFGIGIGDSCREAELAKECNIQTETGIIFKDKTPADPESCIKLGDLYKKQKKYDDAEKYYKRAVDILTVRCDGRGVGFLRSETFGAQTSDGGISCYSLATLYDDGKPDKNRDKAKKYYTKACDRGHKEACKKR